jgi:TonB-linked SusC/RagA family outer membrane protein
MRKLQEISNQSETPKSSCFKYFLGFLIWLFSVCNVSAQNIDVKGIVKTTDGQSLPGATVVIKGTTKGTTTSVNGEFSLNAKAGDLLQVSFIGFVAQDVVAVSSPLTIVLIEEMKALEGVVVIGYGSVRKSDITGSVGTVKVKNLQSIPSNSIDGLLQGRSAGLYVINNSQDPGAGSTVKIRGGSSLRGSNAPLLVVDGFPMGDAGNLKQINPADIAAVEILKDASASAIYGSRGANGVIIVTTNRAKEGTSSINIKQQTNVSRFNSKLNLWRNPVLMAQLSNEGRVNANLPPVYNGEVNSTGIYYPTVEELTDGTWPYYTEWDKVVFRETPVSNNTTLTISSANAKTSYNLGLNYYDENGVYIEDDYKKGIVNLAINHKVYDNFTIRTSNIVSKGYRNYNGGLSYYRNPIWPVYNEDGSYFLSGPTDYSHPLAITENVTNKSNTLDLISSMQFDWQIFKYLNLKSQVNYKYGTSIGDAYYPKKYTEAGDFNNGAASLSNWMGQNLVSETYLTFDKQIKDIHKVTAMVGQSYEYGMSRSSDLYAYDFVNEATGNENMGSGNPEKNRLSNGYSETKLLSFLGRVNYALKDRYLFTATMRADGSSKFGANNKWAYFPSGAVAWKAHNESFIKDLNIFDELKVRASYGISGNQGISPYQTLSRYGVEQYYDNGQWNTAIGPGYVVGSEGDDGRFKIWGGIPNIDLKWETTAQINLGTDMAFYNNRVRLIFDVYQKKTSDLLRERILPLSSGYNRMWVNDGEILNKGFEISLDGDIISNKDFTFGAALIYSRNRNEVVSLGDAVSSGLNTDFNTEMKYEFWGTSLSQFRQTPNILAIGQAVNVIYGYKVDGIIQTEAEGLAAGLTGVLAQPGEFKYVDISGDGQITDKDRTIIGNPNPDFVLSLDLNATYKNFDLEIFLNGVYGNDIIYQNMWGQPNTSPLRWTRDNPTNDYPSLRDDRSYNLSDWFIKDGSFLRIQNVNLGYNFNTAKVKWINKFRLYFNASDLYTFTKFKGYDPEVGSDGIYWGGYPRLSKWAFGLDLTF